MTNDEWPVETPFVIRHFNSCVNIKPKMRRHPRKDWPLDRQRPFARGDFPSFHRLTVADYDRLAVQRHRGADVPWIAVKTIAHRELVGPRRFYYEMFLAMPDRLGLG